MKLLKDIVSKTDLFVAMNDLRRSNLTKMIYCCHEGAHAFQAFLHGIETKRAVVSGWPLRGFVELTGKTPASVEGIAFVGAGAYVEQSNLDYFRADGANGVADHQRDFQIRISSDQQIIAGLLAELGERGSMFSAPSYVAAQRILQNSFAPNTGQHLAELDCVALALHRQGELSGEEVAKAVWHAAKLTSGPNGAATAADLKKRVNVTIAELDVLVAKEQMTVEDVERHNKLASRYDSLCSELAAMGQPVPVAA